MRKVVIHKAGSYDELKLEEHPDLEAGPGEVLIAVEAAGVNYADCIVRMGLYQSAKDYVGWPITPGFEVAGKVAALGEGVEGFAVGDEVFAVSRFFGYADQLVAPAHQVFPKPEGWSLAEAAGFPAVFLTASFALLELCFPRPGHRVLVHSAAGGVGGALCQLARAAGCEVVGVVGRSEKVEVARGFGAQVVIDKSREDLWARAEVASPEGYEMVFDANGVETLRASYDHLRPPGRLVIYGFHTMMPKAGGRPNWLKLGLSWLRTPRFNPLDMTTTNRSVLAFNLSYLFERPEILAEHMGRLQGWIDEGKVKAPPTTTFPLAEVAEAHKAIESGKTVGKLILIP